MVFVNYSTHQMSVKVVYYGPGLCGKTTNLQWIYDHTASGKRGEMLALATETDRTLFFDLLPLEVGTVGKFKTRIQLYTVPGQVFYNSTRKLVLKGVDGVVFVADSQVTMREANVESLDNLAANLAEMELTLEDVPLVLQYNKRDLPEVLSIEELDQSLNRHGWPSIESSAIRGEGVFETLRLISKVTIQSLRQRLSTTEAPKRQTGAMAAVTQSGARPATAPAPPRPRMTHLVAEVRMGDRIVVGRPSTMRIEIGRHPSSPASGSESRFEALVMARDCDVVGDAHQTVVFSDQQSEPIQFELAARCEGRHKVQVAFVQEGRYVGGASLWTQAVRAEHGGPVAAAGARCLVSLDREAKAPDLTLFVTEVPKHDHARTFRFTLHSPANGLSYHALGDEQWFYGSPASWLEGLYGELESLHHRADPDELTAISSAIGADLYEKLFPRELKKLWSEHLRGNLRTVLIVSDELWIPWGLVRPRSEDPLGEDVEDDFLCADCVLSRWLAGPPAPSLFAASRGALVAPGVTRPPLDRKQAGELMRANPGGFAGCLWEVGGDELAQRFSTSFHRALAEGQTLGAALGTVRQELRGLPTTAWLALSLFGDPLARVRFRD